MPDQDTRLARALRDYTADRMPRSTPPFEQVRRLRRRRRRRRAAGAGIVTASAMAATFGVVVAVTSQEPQDVTPAGNPAKTITIDGVELSLDSVTPVQRVRSTTEDPRTIVLEGGRAGDRPTACSAFVTRARVVSETATAVNVAAYLYRADLRADPGTICPGAMPGPAALPVRLERPLGDRSVINDPTGRAVTVVDDRVTMTPGFLPSGYDATPDVTYSPPGLPLTVTQTFDGAAGERLVIEQAPDGPPPAVRSSDEIVGHLRVRGRDGVLSRGKEPSSHTCLSLAEDRGGILVCSFAATPLGRQALVEVAEGLRPA